MNDVTQLLEDIAQFLTERMEAEPMDDHIILEIETLDNPGWGISSILIPGGTAVSDGRKSVGAFDEESQDWWICYEQAYAESPKRLVKTDAVVTAYGGPSYLPIIAEKIFSRVVHGVLNENAVVLNDKLIENLNGWLLVQYDGEWEHSEGIKIVLTSTGQWKFQATNVLTHMLRKDLEQAEWPVFPVLGTKKVWMRDPVIIGLCWYHDSTSIGGLAHMLQSFLDSSELDPAGLPEQP